MHVALLDRLDERLVLAERAHGQQVCRLITPLSAYGRMGQAWHVSFHAGQSLGVGCMQSKCEGRQPIPRTDAGDRSGGGGAGAASAC